MVDDEFDADWVFSPEWKVIDDLVRNRQLATTARRHASAENALISAIPSLSQRRTLAEHIARPQAVGARWASTPVNSKMNAWPGHPLPACLVRYLSDLESAISGHAGSGLPDFLVRILVRTQVLAARYLFDHSEGAYKSFEHYLPETLPIAAGSGDNRRFFCPFHGERSPSLNFSLTSRQWYCHGCGERCTHWSLAAKVMGLGERDAVDYLRRHVGMPRPPWPLPAPRRNPALAVFGFAFAPAEVRGQSAEPGLED